MPYPAPDLYPSPLLYPGPEGETTAPETWFPVASDVLLAIEELMAFRLRARGFSSGAGGVELDHFTEETTPKRSKARTVAIRKTAEVAREFVPRPDTLADLTTIAALRAAIELEASCPNMDPERIKVWRDQLREYVKRAGESGGNEGDDGTLGRDMRPQWTFGGECGRAPGSELMVGEDEACVDVTRRRRKMW